MRCLANIIRRGNRNHLIMSRPTPWRVFLRGFLRLDSDLAFIRLPDSIVQDFLAGTIIGRDLPDGRIKINNHLPIDIEPWTFFNMCKFCIEGLQYGTFQRFLHWRW